MASIMDTIRVRKSCRGYDGRPLVDADRGKLCAYIKEEMRNPFDLQVRMQIIDMEDAPERLGTYGMIRGAATYLCGAVEKGEYALTAYGYVMEKAILAATAMGLGTCWLGGTFSRSSFAKAIALGEGEWLPAVTPLGYPKKKRSLRENLIKAAAGANKRKDFKELFFVEKADTPLSPQDAGPYAEALEAVRLAPSAVNKQPWRVVKTGDEYHFYSAGKAGADPVMRHDLIDLGIAMCHFELAAREKGLAGQWAFAGREQGGLVYIATWVQG